jgi:Zn-dependent protease with chaperone function
MLLRYIIFLLSISCISSITYSASFLERFSKMRARASIITGSEYHRVYFSGTYADAHTQAMVRQIMQTMGFSDSYAVHVMYLNDRGLEEFGVENLIASANTILIDQEWFASLSLDEQRFLLAHELAHIYHHDVRMMSLVAGFTIGLIAYKALKNLGDKDSVWSYAGLLAGCLVMVPTYARYQEQRADIFAAQTLCSSRGGIDCCKRWLYERHHRTYSSRLHQFYCDVLATHPSAARRLEALEALTIS